MRLDDLDLRTAAHRPDAILDRDIRDSACQHLQLGWAVERHIPQLPEQLTLGEVADAFLRCLALYQVEGRHEGSLILPADLLDALARWALSLLGIDVCGRCSALTLGTCLACAGVPRATLRSVPTAHDLPDAALELVGP